MRKRKVINYPSLEPTKITLQQSRLNEGKNTNSYYRVILQGIISKNGDFLRRNLKSKDFMHLQ